MRRAVPSFTVEVRRRPRLASHASQDLQLPETKIWAAAFENESHRLAARTFGAAKAPNRPSGDGATSYPQRRILPSLVPEKPPGGQPPDAFLSAGAPHPTSHARKPTSAAPIEGMDHMPASLRNLEATSELTAQLADKSSDGSARSSASSIDGTAASSGVPTATANDVVADAGGTAPRPMAKPRVRVPIALGASPVPGAAKDRGLITRTDALDALPTVVDEVSRPKRKRTILGRYVFGDELKPGERWKRRLSKGR